MSEYLSIDRFENLRISQIIDSEDETKESLCNKALRNNLERWKALSRKDLYERHVKIVEDCKNLNDGQILEIHRNKLISENFFTEDKLMEYKSQFESRSHFGTLLNLELAEAELELRRYDQESILLQIGRYESFVKIENLSQSDLKLFPFSHRCILTKLDDKSLHSAIVCGVKEDTVYLKPEPFQSSFPKIYKSKRLEPGLYSFGFISNESKSIQWGQPALFYKLEFSSDSDSCDSNDDSDRSSEASSLRKRLLKLVKTRRNYADADDELLNSRMNKLDTQQQNAIKQILKAKYGPYILLGAAGTGKTKTIVELVVQIHQRYPREEILLVARSDFVARELLIELESTGMLEMVVNWTPKLANSKINESQRSSNDHSASKSPIVVVTFEYCRTRALINYTDLIDFLIIDSANTFTEPEIMSIMELPHPRGMTVLVGDSNQMGPRLMSREAASLGLGRPMMTRLTEEVDVYRLEGGEYNDSLITELTFNYRADARVFKPNNQTFYKDRVQCQARTPPSLLKLLDITHPLLFLDTHSDANESVNYTEICLNQLAQLYCIGIEPNQVGVLVTDKLARFRLATALDKQFSHYQHKLEKLFGNVIGQCKFGTVDEFICFEREIMLVLLPPEDQESIGEFQLNTSLSRAKWMNIIIGDSSQARESPLLVSYLNNCNVFRASERFKSVSEMVLETIELEAGDVAKVSEFCRLGKRKIDIYQSHMESDSD